jgi:hypothetical protein
VVWGSNVVWGSTSPFALSTPNPELLTIAINGEN